MSPPPVTFSVVTPETERLDRFLADQLGLSRTQAARIVADGQVAVGERVARASRTLLRGEEVTVTARPDQPMRTLVPHDIDLTIAYEDDHLLVIDKPAGLVVHPAPGHWQDTLVNALVARGTALGGGVEGRPGIVHRLDRDTSGLLVVARTDLAHRRLGAMIAARKVHRIYAALAWGHLAEDRQVIEASIGRHPADRKRMTVRSDGRTARTDASVAARLAHCDLLRLELHSGRTHQIRVHLELIGHPIVGDQVYAGGGARRISGHGLATARRLEALAPRQALHATVLAFRHPITGESLALHSPWPADLWPLLTAAAGTDPLPEREELLRQLGFLAQYA